MARVPRAICAPLVIAALAVACGQGGGSASAHLSVRAAIRHGACLPVHPALTPYRGALALVRNDGGRVRIEVGARGRGRATLAPGRYRLVPPLRGSTVHVGLGGRTVSATGGRYPLRIAAGRTAVLTVVVMPRLGDCTSRGPAA